jgi:hypothetical protein
MCRLDIVDMSLVVVVNEKVKRIVPVSVVTRAFIDDLVASFVEDGPFALFLSEIGGESLA